MLGQQARKEAEVMHGWSHTARELEVLFNHLLYENRE